MAYKELPSKSLQSPTSLRWIDIHNPTQQDQETLYEQFPFLDEDDLAEAIEPALRSKIVKREHYFFLVVLIPIYSPETREIDIQEMNLYITKDMVITLHDQRFSVIDRIQKECEESEELCKEYLQEGLETFIYTLLYDFLEYSYPIIDALDTELERLKKSVFQGDNSKKVVQESLILRRNITDMRRAMRAHAIVFEHMIKKEPGGKVMELQEYPAFQDLIDYAKEIWELLESAKESIEALEDANEALISHTLNTTIKTLTAFSTILLPTIVVASIFGMNVKNPPIIGHEIDFWILIFFMGMLSFILFLIFWKKNWLK